MDSTGPICPRQPLAANQTCDRNLGNYSHTNWPQHSSIEMEAQMTAGVSPSAVYQCDTATRHMETVASGRPMEKSCDHSLESCGVLAFMSSSDSVELSPKSRGREGDREDLENCGTLVFMSSANSIGSSTVPIGTQIAWETSNSAPAATTAVCAGTTLAHTGSQEVAKTQNNTLINFSTTADETEGTVRGGVTPSVSTESNKLREKTYGGKTVGLGAVRELASLSHRTSSTGQRQSSAATVGGFSNPFSGEERCSHLVSEGTPQEQARPAHTVQEYFPPPVKVSLTAQPMASDQQSSVPTSL